MPLTFFDTQNGDGQLPFLNEYKGLLTSIGVPFEVMEVKKVSSGKGYIASTECFSVFLWSKKTLTIQVIEALEAYTQTGIGYALYIVPSDIDGNYQIAGDLEVARTWRLNKQGKYSVVTKGTPSSIEASKNPFLPVALTPSTTSRKKTPTTPTDV